MLQHNMNIILKYIIQVHIFEIPISLFRHFTTKHVHIEETLFILIFRAM